VNLQLPVSLHVPAHLSLDNDIFGFNIGLNDTGVADKDITGQHNGSFEIALHMEVFRSLNFPFNSDIFAQ
jgi:hypothetical protein